MNHEINKIIDKGIYYKKEISSFIETYAYTSKDREIIIIAYYSLLIEHHESIHLLIKNKLFGSAFALVRSLHELLYKSHWVYKCANNQQIKKIIKGKDIYPEMKEIIIDIDKAFMTDNFWQNIHKSSWSAMNDYTHTGIRQMSRRFNFNDVSNNYSIEEVIEVLNGSNMAYLLISLLFTYVFHLSNETDIIKKMIMNYNNSI